MAPKAKTWCFTLNNPEPSPDGETKTHWRTGPQARRILDQECQVLIIGYEVGESGTEHLQGYITYKYSKTKTAQKKLCPKAHWSIGRADECAANYCMKDWDYVKKDYRQQGARCDIMGAVETLRAHGIKRLKKEHPVAFLKYHTGFDKLDMLNEDERDFRPDVLWLWGTTGTGKSYFAKNIYPSRTRWWSGKNLKWWQGYRGEDIVIIDDFRKDFCTYHELLRILDENPYKVEVKGSHRELNSRMIIITTIDPPLELYRDLPGERLDQLTRRITKVVHCTHLDGTRLGGPGTMGSYVRSTSRDVCKPYLWEKMLMAQAEETTQEVTIVQRGPTAGPAGSDGAQPRASRVVTRGESSGEHSTGEGHTMVPSGGHQLNARLSERSETRRSQHPLDAPYDDPFEGMEDYWSYSAQRS